MLFWSILSKCNVDSASDYVNLLMFSGFITWIISRVQVPISARCHALNFLCSLSRVKSILFFFSYASEYLSIIIQLLIYSLLSVFSFTIFSLFFSICYSFLETFTANVTSYWLCVILLSYSVVLT